MGTGVRMRTGYDDGRDDLCVCAQATESNAPFRPLIRARTSRHGLCEWAGTTMTSDPVSTLSAPRLSVLRSPAPPPARSSEGVEVGVPTVPGAVGTDRRVSRRPQWGRRLAVAAGTVAVVGAIAVALGPHDRELRVASSRVLIAPVVEATFQPSISVVGQVVPETSIRLDAVEGGRVEAVFVRDGVAVAAGQPLARLANPDLQLRVLGADAERAAQRDRLQGQRLASTSGALDLRRSLLDAEHAARQATDALARQQQLRQAGAISDQELAIAQSTAEHADGQLAIARSALAAAESQAAQQTAQVGRELGALERTAGVTRGLLADLVVRAPVAGILSGFDLQVGTLVTPGTTLGHVDRVGEARIRAALDEHYLATISEGLPGTVAIGQKTYAVTLARVFPEVAEGRFEAEFIFDGTIPTGLRKGQALRMTVRLGEPRPALTLPRGPYLDAAAGAGLFVVAADGRAVRRSVRLGEQSPEAVEVTSGLSPGDRVVVSSYEAFGDAARLHIEGL